MTETPYSRRHNAIRDRLEPLVRVVSPSIRVLFGAKKGRVPRHAGACVLVEIAGTRFLFTASHVLGALSGYSIGVGGVDRMLEVPGASYRTLPLGEGEPDRLDAGVVKVEEGALDEIAGCFLSVDMLETRDAETQGREYMLLGYPESRTRVDPRVKRVKQTHLLRYLGNGADHTDYQQVGAAPVSHVALPFNHNQVGSLTGVRTPLGLAGVSGSGLWRVWRDRDTIRTSLAAIFTDHHRTLQLLLGVRVCSHLELIRSRWPAFRDLIPRTWPADLMNISHMEEE